MTIQEVLEADWNVDRMEVTVRKPTGEFIIAYVIGRDVKPSKYHQFQYEAKAGDVYSSQGMKYVFINRIIQHHQLDGIFREKARSYGALLDEIPKELLTLEISTMSPYHCGRADFLHGYRFGCRVDTWEGINGESEETGGRKVNEKVRNEHMVEVQSDV